FLSLAASANSSLPKGLMLNLDLEEIQDGLIPSKTLFPLYVPQGDLGIERFYNRNMLAFQEGQWLDIPHSSLLDPDGSEWVVSVRAFVLTDGMVISQGNDKHGYAIYIKDYTVQAVVRTDNVAITIKESAKHIGITKYRKKWVTIELQIKEDCAYLLLNRKRVARVSLNAPLKGENMPIRLGTHTALPTVLKNKTNLTPAGFTGAISSLKVTRQ
ncbi:MAG: hypothetical protein OES84_04395, partial [Kiritimatiellaceae bacterium]|nr:hypothetical protein [Kiritimatiellaceae bacterium]